MRYGPPHQCLVSAIKAVHLHHSFIQRERQCHQQTKVTCSDVICLEATSISLYLQCEGGTDHGKQNINQSIGLTGIKLTHWAHDSTLSQEVATQTPRVMDHIVNCFRTAVRMRARRFQTRMGVTWVHRSVVTEPNQGRVTHLRETPRLDAEGSGTRITGGHIDQRGASVIISQVTTLWSQACWSAWPSVNSTSSQYTFRISNAVFVRAPTGNDVFDKVH